jgi:hypothetical protein
MTYSSCPAAANYCARTFPPCSGLGCLTRGEVFRDLTAREAEAVVEHAEIDSAWTWNVSWFDPKAGLSYRLELFAASSDFSAFDKNGMSANNFAGAKQAAALADKLALWSGS